MQRLEDNHSKYAPVMDQSCEPSSVKSNSSSSRKRPIEVIDLESDSDSEPDPVQIPEHKIPALIPVQLPISDSVTATVPVPVSNSLTTPFVTQSEDVITLSDSDDDVVFFEPGKEEEIINDTDEEQKERRFFATNNSLSQRQKMQLNAKVVIYCEWPNFRTVMRKILRIIRRIPMLYENLDVDVPEIENEPVLQMRTIRLHQQFNVDLTYATVNQISKCANKKRTEEVKITIKNEFERLQKFGRYQPPNKRLQIMKNLTFDVKNPLPVYCDRTPHDLKRKVDIPETLIFDYITENVIGEESKSKLEKIIKLAEENIISCDCCKDGKSMVKCYENPNCICYKMNAALAKLQEIGPYRKEPTKFKTFEEIKMRDIDHYYDTFAFSCSASCKCKGCCDNNVMYTIEKNLNRFELFRYDNKGFCIRPLNYIPYGSPVFQFTGEIVDNKTVAIRNSVDYAFTICDAKAASDQLNNLIDRTKEIDDVLKVELKKMYKSTWNIDPKKKGNEARFVSHGCHPNLSVCRVFQKGLAPHQTKLIMVSLEDIFPGTPLTFDYGPKYVEEQLSNNCLCNTAGCSSSKKILSKATFKEMYWFLSNRNIELCTNYNVHVSGKMTASEAERQRNERGSYFMVEPEDEEDSSESNNGVENSGTSDVEKETDNYSASENCHPSLNERDDYYSNEYGCEVEQKSNDYYSNEYSYDVEAKSGNVNEHERKSNDSNSIADDVEDRSHFSSRIGEKSCSNGYKSNSGYDFSNDYRYDVGYESYSGAGYVSNSGNWHGNRYGFESDGRNNVENEYPSEPNTDTDGGHTFEDYY